MHRIHDELGRQLLDIYQGYEITMQGDSFETVFPNTVSAVRFALTLQKRLLEVPWGNRILSHPSCKTERMPDGRLLYRGPRIRIGIHFASQGEFTRKEKHNTQTTDYSGPAVIFTRMLCDAAAGGQVLLSASAWCKLRGRLAEANYPVVQCLGLYSFQTLSTAPFQPILQIHPPMVSVIAPRYFGSDLRGAKREVDGMGMNVHRLLSFSPDLPAASSFFSHDIAVVAIRLTYPATTTGHDTAVSGQRRVSQTPMPKSVREEVQRIACSLAQIFMGQLNWQGYSKDIFVVLFQSPQNAVRYAMAAQVALLFANWNQEDISAISGERVEKMGELIFQGPRFAIAVHASNQVNVRRVKCADVKADSSARGLSSPFENSVGRSLGRRMKLLSGSQRSQGNTSTPEKKSKRSQAASGSKENSRSFFKQRSDSNKKAESKSQPSSNGQLSDLLATPVATSPIEYSNSNFNRLIATSSDGQIEIDIEHCSDSKQQFTVSINEFDTDTDAVDVRITDQVDASMANDSMMMTRESASHSGLVQMRHSASWNNGMNTSGEGAESLDSFCDPWQFFGEGIDECRDLVNVAYGGQTIVSGNVWKATHAHIPVNAHVLYLGRHRLTAHLDTARAVMEMSPQRLGLREFPPLVAHQTLETGYRSSPEPEKGVAVMFANVANIPDHLPESVLQTSIRLYTDCLRGLLGDFQGTECKEPEPGKFTLAFHTLHSALLFACVLQKRLLYLSWPSELLSCPTCGEETSEGGELLQRGLSVSVGCAWGVGLQNCFRKPLKATGRPDYFGSLPNLAARVLGQAHPKQVLVEGPLTLDKDNNIIADMTKNKQYPPNVMTKVDRNSSKNLISMVCKGVGYVDLKGIEEYRWVYSVSLEDLDERTFPRPKGAVWTPGEPRISIERVKRFSSRKKSFGSFTDAMVQNMRRKSI